jgi:hypothetical protein
VSPLRGSSYFETFPRPHGLGSIISPRRGLGSSRLGFIVSPNFVICKGTKSSKSPGLSSCASPARQGGIIEPTATGVPGKPVFGLLGQVSGGYGEKKVQAPL